jgi:periplasmic divalent cation tolerance protein
MDECKDRDILTVTTTVASRAEAQALAGELLARRLAACVQVEEGLTSFYRWQGKDCVEAEVRLTIKSLPRCAGALQALFGEQHPYEVPQFAAWTAQASEAYAAWVRAEVSVPSPASELDAP